jgi:hypothetical protein
VRPVVSDLDALLIGTRNVRFDPLPPEQVELLHWCTARIAEVLAEPSTAPWMRRWLEILKKASDDVHPAPKTHALVRLRLHWLHPLCLQIATCCLPAFLVSHPSASRAYPLIARLPSLQPFL